MDKLDFNQWLQLHPSLENRIIKENSKWGRIVTEWKEKKEDGTNITHLFAISINLKTGDCYLDCRRRKIWAKQAVLILARPFQGGLKTLYHLSMIPVVHEIFQGLTGKQSAKKTLKNVGKSIADIVRTPVYAIAMMIVGLAAVAIIPLAPNTAYDFRVWHGKLEQRLFWGEKHTDFTVAICFQSIFNVREFESDDGFVSKHKDTKYKSLNKEEIKQNRAILRKLKKNLAADKELVETLKGSKKRKTSRRIRTAEKLIKNRQNEIYFERRLTNFARTMIKDRRFHYNPFYQLIGKLDPNVEYKSAFLLSHPLKPAESAEESPVERKTRKRNVLFNSTLDVQASEPVKVNFNSRADGSRPKHRAYQKESGSPLRDILGNDFHDQSPEVA